MKTIHTKIIALSIVGALAFTATTAFAGQNWNSSKSNTAAVKLPDAGFTPDSVFYFLDRLGESLQEFFTFNPEAKARLQITFAAERVAEIKVMLEAKGVEAKGLDVAESRLKEHLAKAATLVESEKNKGKDVSKLAKDLDDEFDGPKSALDETFKAQRRELETREKALNAKLREARQAGDTAQIDALTKELGALKAQKELLESKGDEQDEALEKEQERLEKEVGDKESAEKAIGEAGEEKQGLLDGAAEHGVTLPADAFEKFDRLLSQAKELFDRGNYEGAKQLARQAEKSLDKVDEAIDELKDAKENKQGENEQGENEHGGVEESDGTIKEILPSRPSSKEHNIAIPDDQAEKAEKSEGAAGAVNEVRGETNETNDAIFKRGFVNDPYGAGVMRQKIGDLLLSYGIGGAEINRVTDALEAGISEARLKELLVQIAINEDGVQAVSGKTIDIIKQINGYSPR